MLQTASDQRQLKRLLWLGSKGNLFRQPREDWISFLES